MNSTHTPNTPTNTPESVGGAPETLAVTNIPKTKNFKKYTEIPVSRKPTCTWPKPKNKKMSDHVTSVSVGETSPDAANNYIILRKHARGNSRANGGVCDMVQQLICRPHILKILEISENTVSGGRTKTKVPKVRLWHSNVSAPSAR